MRNLVQYITGVLLLVLFLPAVSGLSVDRHTCTDCGVSSIYLLGHNHEQMHQACKAHEPKEEEACHSESECCSNETSCNLRNEEDCCSDSEFLLKLDQPFIGVFIHYDFNTPIFALPNQHTKANTDSEKPAIAKRISTRIKAPPEEHLFVMNCSFRI